MTPAQADLFELTAAARKRGNRTPREAPSGGQYRPAVIPYQRSSPTSKAAAKSIEPHVNRMQTRILNALRDRIGMYGDRGLTREEMTTYCGLSIQTVCARVNELLKLGLIRETDQRRKTRSGRLAAVLEIA